MKVIIIDWAFKKGVVGEGEWDGNLIIDKQYAKINGELYNIHTMYIDTPETREFISKIIVEYNRMKDEAEKYFFNQLNEIERRGYVATKQSKK